MAEIAGVPKVSSDATFVPMNFVLWLYVKITCSVITGKDFFFGMVLCFENCFALVSKLCIPSTVNIDLILWHTQLIVCAIKC